MKPHLHLLLAALLALLAAAAAQAAGRVALVIGNGKYQHADVLPKLPNPTNDAEDIAKVMRGFGFEVIERKDLTLEQMSDAITEFSRKIGNSEAALFYYSGHGLQVKGQNYLIPIDAKIDTEAQVAFKSVNVNQVLEEMDNAKSKANIVMLDACRANPLSGKFRTVASRGLAPPSSQPAGTVIVYATDPGNVASDGEGRNGLFTGALLDAFKGKDLSLGGVLTQASEAVEKRSEKKQTPYVNGPLTLQKSFQFGSNTQVVSLHPEPVAAQRSAAQLEEDTWQAALDAKSIAGYEAYLADYGKGKHAGQAKIKLAELKKALEVAAQPAVATPAPSPASTPQSQYGPTASARAGELFKDCLDCPKMVVIPAGSFEMGSPGSEAGRHNNEGPTHRVDVAKFALSETHITRGQFAAFVNATGYQAGNECFTYVGGSRASYSGRSWRDPGFPQEDNHPVVCVNWKDAKAYTQWLSKKTGKNYRLPSEAEMEYAIRAGTTTARYWGESPDQACGYANVGDQTLKAQVSRVTWETHNCNDGYAYTSPVAHFMANAFGLYDMIGNAWAWVEDCWQDNYDGAPTDGSAWISGQCDRRVQRGGSWSFQPQYARAAGRNLDDPEYRFDYSGFRLARMLL